MEDILNPIFNIIKMDIAYLRLFPDTHHDNAFSFSTTNDQRAGPCLYMTA